MKAERIIQYTTVHFLFPEKLKCSEQNKKKYINIYKHNTIIWKGKTKHLYLKYCTVKYNKYNKDKF